MGPKPSADLSTAKRPLGAGQRLFGEASGKKPMRLIGTRTVGDGLAFLTYQPARDA
ncbi:hypothetical protein ACFWR9_20450 [Streptomyces sp. NPDC058534]|uniref:hypothetical protein n=1 Tax=Streptomyces sp. NPDC058534 TaxID=3346541 RepID=UPI00364D1D6C